MSPRMEGAVLMLCSYGRTNVVIRLHQALTFADLISGICGKFEGLDSEMVVLFIKVHGYNKFCVLCDEDVRNMFSLAKSFGLNHVDVIIQLRNGGDGGDEVCMADTGSKAPGYGMFGLDDRTNLLQLYCQHRSKTYLSAGWASGVTNVGQCFIGGADEFRTVLSKYAIECGFQFKYVKNDSVPVTAVCKFAGSTGCLWSVHARVFASNGVFCLKRFSSVHTCGAVVRMSRNPRTGSDLVADVVADRVCAQPLTRPTDVVFGLKNDYGLDISYRVAWLGVEKARSEVYGDHVVSFDQLRWYSDAVMENNPNSYINLDFQQ
ncbi:hypothetical protein ACSBR2_022641 [Camellia fascicularis]